MLKVLRTSAEVNEAMAFIKDRNLPLHKTPQKNWDHQLLVNLLEDFQPDSKILDLGCGGGYALKLMHDLGFRDLFGLDFDIPSPKIGDHLARMFGGFRTCFHARKGDLCKTGLADATYDLVTCISVIEHDVDVPAFLRESARLLKPGGKLFVTYDYWEDFDPEQQEEIRLFDLAWNIQNRDMVVAMIAEAERLGLVPIEDTDLPPCEERTVSYAGRDYTFMAAGFEKRA
jgi:SAM-dependent methyltransferase